MARSADPNSADSQWYIAETEAHGLNPENRDDEGYATFGVVRHGMSHVRAIATVPTTDDPSGEEIFVNPASTAGRPLYEVQILSVRMVGVIQPSNDDMSASSDKSFIESIVSIGRRNYRDVVYFIIPNLVNKEEIHDVILLSDDGSEIGD